MQRIRKRFIYLGVLLITIFIFSLFSFRPRASTVFLLENINNRSRLYDEELPYCYNYTLYQDRVYNAANAWHSRAERLMKRNYKIEIIFTDSIYRHFTKSVNRLSSKAYIQGVDYLLLISKATFRLLSNTNWKSRFIKILKEHSAQNIGIVIPANGNGNRNETVETEFIFIHRSHMEIFQLFFPRKVEYEYALIWIQEIYKPFLVTKVQLEEKFETNSFTSVKFEIGNGNGNRLFRLDRTKVHTYMNSMSPIKVISFSLYGADARYTDGALANADLMKLIYPDWKMWIFHDVTVPISVLSTMCLQKHVKCIDMTGSTLRNRMSWRFLVASVPFITRYAIRDIDARISLREKAAVDEWILSSKRFHVIRDHPSHSLYSISGGLWGGTKDAVPHMETLLQNNSMEEVYFRDMDFTRDVIWPIATQSLYQHDSFSCDKFGGGNPFPTRRVGFEHVGSVFINESLRQVDIELLKNATASPRCNCI